MTPQKDEKLNSRDKLTIEDKEGLLVPNMKDA